MPERYKLNLPDSYRDRLPRSWRPWLDQLPELVNEYLERWELEVVAELPLSYNYVLAVERSDGRQCVLKVQPTGIPDVEGAERELLGLRLAGSGAIEVVDDDATAGVLLLERAIPGTTLDDMVTRGDDLATETLAIVIAQYGRPLNEPESFGLRNFNEFAEAFEKFDRGPHGEIARHKLGAAPETRLSIVLGMDELGTPVPAMRRARYTAEEVMDELVADKVPPYLLHGDLHHGNVLLDEEQGLRVIDPWGLYGEQAADVGAALHNPLDFVGQADDAVALIKRRLSIYAEVIGLDHERLVAWSYVYNVIRTLWSLEDRDDLPENDSGVVTVAALRTMI